MSNSAMVSVSSTTSSSVVSSSATTSSEVSSSATTSSVVTSSSSITDSSDTTSSLVIPGFSSLGRLPDLAPLFTTSLTCLSDVLVFLTLPNYHP